MTTRPVLALLCMTLSPLLAHAADAASALQRLESARSSLTKAVERIKQDPPSNADLDAAHAAVEALKEAVDAGAELEQNDLDYAKSALAARKELRTQRDYVDQRRANVKIHDARRAIETAVKTLNEASAKLKDKTPAASVFADTRSAAQAVKKLADESRPFGKQDPKFATYVTEVDATVAKQLAAADERETLLAIDKQRAVIDEARQNLKTVAGAVGKDATDDQFKAVDKATADLTKALEDGKPLEAKNKPFQADGAKVRAELQATKKRVDELWTATGLARLKAEIEPQYKDLVTASKPLRGKPTEEQLAEARTAAIVVRKLVEKFQPEAQRSQAFGQYVAQVQRTLAETETQIEQRSLSAAQTEVYVARRNVEKKSPTDEHFQELATALTVLEKTLGTVHQNEPLMAKPVGEAQFALKDSKQVMERRRLEVDVERQTAKVEDAKKIAADAMQQLQAPVFGQEQVDRAEAAVKLFGTVLEPGNALLEKDKTYKWYDGEAKKKIAEMNGKIAARKIVLAGNLAKAALIQATATAKAKIETAKAPEGKDSDLSAAVDSVDALTKLLETQTPLEKQDRTYATQAEKGRNDLYGLTDLLDFTKLARELRKKTGEALTAGMAANGQGAAMKDLRGRKGQFEKALGFFRNCQSEGLQLMKMLPALAKIPVLFDAKPMTPREVMDLCGARASETEVSMKEVAPLIKFEDGPKKSYEAGKALVDKGKKNDALPQINECIATGIMLEHDNPEFSDRKFEVAGTQLTLGEMIKYCVAQRKAIVGK